MSSAKIIDMAMTPLPQTSGLVETSDLVPFFGGHDGNDSTHDGQTVIYETAQGTAANLGPVTATQAERDTWATHNSHIPRSVEPAKPKRRIDGFDMRSIGLNVRDDA